MTGETLMWAVVIAAYLFAVSQLILWTRQRRRGK